MKATLIEVAVAITCIACGGSHVHAQPVSGINGQVLQDPGDIKQDFNSLGVPPVPPITIPPAPEFDTDDTPAKEIAQTYTYCDLSGGAWCRLTSGPAHIDCWCTSHGKNYWGRTKNETTARQ
jgi:hypothetical protein